MEINSDRERKRQTVKKPADHFVYWRLMSARMCLQVCIYVFPVMCSTDRSQGSWAVIAHHTNRRTHIPLYVGLDGKSVQINWMRAAWNRIQINKNILICFFFLSFFHFVNYSVVASAVEAHKATQKLIIYFSFDPILWPPYAVRYMISFVRFHFACIWKIPVRRVVDEWNESGMTGLTCERISSAVFKYNLRVVLIIVIIVVAVAIIILFFFGLSLQPFLIPDLRTHTIRQILDGNIFFYFIFHFRNKIFLHIIMAPWILSIWLLITHVLQLMGGREKEREKQKLW